MRLCSVLDCERKHLAKGLCSKHYDRQKAGRGILEPTRFDRRPAILDGEVAKLELANGKGYTLVDREFAYLDKHNWSCDGYGYPCTWIDSKIWKIHHVIMGKPPKGYVTDHISRDRLDNRKCNLRFVTQRMNMENSSIPEYWFDKGSNTNKAMKKGTINGRYPSTTSRRG